MRDAPDEREFRFNGFLLQVAQRRVLAPDGIAVELSPRLFDALLLLVEHAGELLDKDRLLAELWPGLVVEENSLSQTISALRKALGDDAREATFIQTVPRRGFRFVAPVALVAPAPPVLPVLPVQPIAPPPPAEALNVQAPGVDAAGAAVEVAVVPRRRLAAAGLGVLALAAAGAAAWRWRAAQGGAPSGRPISLAVLPFKPVGTSGDVLLEVGMAESLVSRLSNLPGVAVRSVSSVRRYTGAEQDPIAAARELSVTWILDGSIQRLDGRTRVNARLLNADSGEAAWSGSFDEAHTGVFDVQDSISTKVALVLAPHLQRSGQRRLAGAGSTRNVEAYQLYLTARQQAQGIRTAGLEKSIGLFKQAIALDPQYALAFAGMAESYRRMVFGADGEPAVVMVEAGKLNRRAIELDPELAEAHAGLGWNLFWYDWDWPGATRAFEHALQLSASEANAHLGFSQLLQLLGDNEQSLLHLRLARENDPLSLILLTLESGQLAGAGRIDEARHRLQRVFDIEPDFWVAHMTQSSLLRAEGKITESLDSLARADRLADGSSQAAAALGYSLARNGRAEEARQVLARLLLQAKTRYLPPTSSGVIHLGLREHEAAMQALDQAFAVRDTRMTLVPIDGRWAQLRGDPRFVELIQRMKLKA